MRVIGRAFGSHTFAIAVFIAVYVGLLAIAFTPSGAVAPSVSEHDAGGSTMADASGIPAK